MVYSRHMADRRPPAKGASTPPDRRRKKGKPSLPVVGQSPQLQERADAARNRAKILDAARCLLEERPIGEICMDELARRAGVGKGTVYRRFADRASLCRALLDEDARAIQEQVLSGFGLPLNAAWTTRCLKLLEALFDFTLRNASLLSEAKAFERGCPTRYDRPAHAWQRDSLSLYLRRAVESGEIATLDPVVAAEQLLGGLEPDLVRWHLTKGRNAGELLAAYQILWRNTVGT